MPGEVVLAFYLSDPSCPSSSRPPAGHIQYRHFRLMGREGSRGRAWGRTPSLLAASLGKGNAPCPLTPGPLPQAPASSAAASQVCLEVLLQNGQMYILPSAKKPPKTPNSFSWKIISDLWTTVITYHLVLPFCASPYPFPSFHFLLSGWSNLKNVSLDG